jgi:cytoskeletal protein CcmA (bactofilin family)
MSSYGEAYNNGSRNMERAFIPRGTVINGDIQISGKLDMYGAVNGNINSDDYVNVIGNITGNVKAEKLDTKDSFIVGDIECGEAVAVNENAVIFGNINSNSLVINGAVQGKIDVKGDVIVGDKAIVDSDIKAKTIEVSNGAAINGYCSLCYSDVKVREVFPEETKPAESTQTTQNVEAADKKDDTTDNNEKTNNADTPEKQHKNNNKKKR